MKKQECDGTIFKIVIGKNEAVILMIEYELYWERTKDGNARLLRVYGTTPYVSIPSRIAGYPLTELGAYCFAVTAHLPEVYERTTVSMGDSFEENIYSEGIFSARRNEHTGVHEESDCSGAESDCAGRMRELSGKYIEEVRLPDTVQKIGNLTFYHCMSLRKLVFGNALNQIGSDAFMNCRNLHEMTLRGGCRKASGMRQILAQISSDMEVTFETEKGIEAVLLFPEYYESYDEIAPAHLFGRNIEGEGFRARQCFKDGIMDFKQYDAIFPKACVEESERTLCRLAVNRLLFPVDLGEEECKLYVKYIRAHADYICERVVKERDMGRIQFLAEQKLLDKSDMENCIRLAAKEEWAEGSAYFLRLKEQYFSAQKKGDRYSFDDF